MRTSQLIWMIYQSTHQETGIHLVRCLSSSHQEQLNELTRVVLDDTFSISIPTQASIAEAKEKRERLRGAPADSEDFISLSVTRTGGTDAPKGPHPNSRLVREEDEMGEGDDGAFCFSSQKIKSIISVVTRIF